MIYGIAFVKGVELKGNGRETRRGWIVYSVLDIFSMTPLDSNSAKKGERFL